ncbi:MAG: hypothetical protein Kow00105_13990 [Phycisphaeraceae bacterium]
MQAKDSMTDMMDRSMQISPPAARGGRKVGRLVVPPKRYKMGELASATGLSRQTLHNYTKWGLIQASGWTPGGHRLYDESVFARLEQIMRLKARMTVEQVREILQQGTDTTGDQAA